MPDVIATGDCRVDGVLAAKEGDPVPSELAEKYDWPVAKPGTKKAQAATEPDES